MNHMQVDLPRRLAAELLGTTIFVATVVGLASWQTRPPTTTEALPFGYVFNRP